MEARIVVVDNDDDMRELFTLCLNDAGWEVLAYDFAHIGLSSLKQLRSDLIILDFNKEDGGTGWEFLQLLKMDDTTAKIPILIVTTAYPLSAEIQGYLLARYIYVVHKPFDLDAFILMVQKTLASKTRSVFSGDRSLPILLVEDTRALRETLETVLRLEGHQVVTAENGLLALEAVHTADSRETLMAKRYQKIQAAFTDLAPLWLINDEYHPKVDSFVFNIVYCHPVHGWINQHVRYDTFNDALYHIGESSVSQEALLLLEENDPFVSGNGTASIPNHPGNRL